MISAANTGGESVVSSESFGKLCYRISKYKCETFFNQWVLASGCPRFQIAQKFNKKRLCVELTISQKQDGLPTEHTLRKENFLREFKEEAGGVWSQPPQAVFTGPMTIRIHEADGTPYEHIVEIREGVGKFEIPYNTKYKRLKRSRRQKERANAAAGIDMAGDNQDDVLIYCLGDVLQNKDEVREWDLRDWDPETEADMDKESYEWIRIDADFEWLCDLNFVSMKPYMYVSQLQQDRDVVAQQDSITFLGKAVPHPLVSTFLIRTVMDRRYFHGIRTMAAECLKTHATKNCDWIGLRHLEKAFQEFFCYPGTRTPKSNDFNDKKAYYVLCAIPRAMAKIRNSDGDCPKDARHFILDQLRFNDNGNNEFSDNHYVANLLTALADCLIPIKKNGDEVHFRDEDEEFDPEPKQFKESVIEEIDRYRRMDEWIHSYQNIYTTTALDCKQRLMKGGVIPTDPVEFVQYLHDGTADLVRIKAFEALVDLGYLSNDAVVEYLLTVMSTDGSPFVRRRLFEVFCLGLATIAFGENKTQETPAPAAEEDGLIVEGEGEATLAARQAQIARTKDILGAIAALKDELKGHTTLKAALWKAINSPVIGVTEQCDLLDVCWMLYDVEDEFVINMKLPRYWEVENLGKGLMRFKQTDKVRGRISKYTLSKIKPAAPLPPPPPQARPVSIPESKPVPKPVVTQPAALPRLLPPPPPTMTIPPPTAATPPIVAPPISTSQPLKINFKPAKPSISTSKPASPLVKPSVNPLKLSSNPMKLTTNPMRPAVNPANPVKTALNLVKPSSTPSHSSTISVKTPAIKTPGTPKPAMVRIKSEDGQMRPPKRPRSPELVSDSIKVEKLEGQPRKKIIKLKVENFSKVLQIQSRSPNPAPPKIKKQRSNSTSIPHPSTASVPRPSPAPSSTSSFHGASPTPAARKSKMVTLKYGKGRLNLGNGSGSRSSTEGERKPLPDAARKPLPDTGRKPLPDTSGRKPLPDTSGRKPLPESLPKRPSETLQKRPSDSLLKRPIDSRGFEPSPKRRLIVKLAVPSLYKNSSSDSSISKDKRQ
ncbi:hypothetical protein PVAG01_06306 [Phlyctema vagabunda]|uniref:Uncharacterized protein n=1 Tax=Phlyctema vagabunda TaxID=108571 RepID=A0ABR4PFV9_9HELO